MTDMSLRDQSGGHAIRFDTSRASFVEIDLPSIVSVMLQVVVTGNLDNVVVSSIPSSNFKLREDYINDLTEGMMEEDLMENGIQCLSSSYFDGQKRGKWLDMFVPCSWILINSYESDTFSSWLAFTRWYLKAEIINENLTRHSSISTLLRFSFFTSLTVP